MLDAFTRPHLYMLDEQGKPVPTWDVIEFGKWFQTADRQIAETYFGEIRVSTVFLGMDHGLGALEDGPPVLYETMVFADEDVLAKLVSLSETDDRSIIARFTGDIDIQRRYITKEEALQGHAQICAFIRVCVANGYIQGTGEDMLFTD